MYTYVDVERWVFVHMMHMYMYIYLAFYTWINLSYLSVSPSAPRHQGGSILCSHGDRDICSVVDPDPGYGD